MNIFLWTYFCYFFVIRNFFLDLRISFSRIWKPKCFTGSIEFIFLKMYSRNSVTFFLFLKKNISSLYYICFGRCMFRSMYREENDYINWLMIQKTAHQFLTPLFLQKLKLNPNFFYYNPWQTCFVIDTCSYLLVFEQNKFFLINISISYKWWRNIFFFYKFYILI